METSAIYQAIDNSIPNYLKNQTGYKSNKHCLGKFQNSNVSFQQPELLEKNKTNAFGPQTNFSNKIKSQKELNRVIHYDCIKLQENCDDVPNEDEIYVKSNLLREVNDSDGDDISLVNINVSVLFSSNNSCTLEYSPSSHTKQSKEESNSSKINKHFSLQKISDSSNKINTSNNSFNFSNNSNSNISEGNFIKMRISNFIKTKRYHDKMKKLRQQYKTSKDVTLCDHKELEEDELSEIKDTIDENNLKSITKSRDSQILIKNRLKYISKTFGEGNNIYIGKSIINYNKSANLLNESEPMIKDLSSLHLITMKALNEETRSYRKSQEIKIHNKFYSSNKVNQPNLSRADKVHPNPVTIININNHYVFGNSSTHFSNSKHFKKCITPQNKIPNLFRNNCDTISPSSNISKPNSVKSIESIIKSFKSTDNSKKFNFVKFN